ncbi:MAG: hypothetical protein RLZZ172_2542, partial [Bacteroidota bacterium]
GVRGAGPFNAVQGGLAPSRRRGLRVPDGGGGRGRTHQGNCRVIMIQQYIFRLIKEGTNNWFRTDKICYTIVHYSFLFLTH